MINMSAGQTMLSPRCLKELSQQMETTIYYPPYWELEDKFGFRFVAITLRQSRSASDNGWSGLLYDGQAYHFSRTYDIHVVDRVGAGDAFAAGLIYGLLSGQESAEVIEFAAAASCLKHSITGDFNMVTVDEVCSLLREGGSGRVQR